MDTIHGFIGHAERNARKCEDRGDRGGVAYWRALSLYGAGFKKRATELLVGHGARDAETFEFEFKDAVATFAKGA